MRYIYTFFLSILVAFNAFAELSPSEQKLERMLLSGDMQQLKMAAQGIEDRALSNPELLDIAAEILLKTYPQAYSSEIDTLAWVARAIGESENGRYYDVLNEVVENADEKKLVRHAKKARRALGDAEGEQYTAGMYSLAAGLYAREDDVTRDKRIMGLLMEGDLSSLKQGARAIVDTNAKTQVLIDTAAEILITYYANASDAQIDTFSWLATAIGQSESGRYASVLAEVEENGSHRKLRGYAEDALENLGEASGEQYQKGMLGKDIPRYDF